MKAEASAAVAKSVATGAGAAALFGLTWWAVLAAVIGAAASLHFEEERQPGSAWRVFAGIVALAFVAALLASAAPSIPGFGWTDNVLIEVRAGLLGVVANPVVKLARRLIGAWKGPGG